MIPGARTSRYGTPFVGIACRRLKVVPKISSHSTGCTARVTSSERSCRIFWSSTRQNVATRLGYARQTGAPARSADPAGGTASASDCTQASIHLFVSVERLPGELPEHVLERRAEPDRGLQLVRRPLGPHPAEMHQRDAVA